MTTTTLNGPKLAKRLAPDALDQLFHKARTHNGFHNHKPVPRALLEDLYDLARMDRPVPTVRRAASSS